MTAKREGAKASQGGKKPQVFRDLAAGKRKRTRSRHGKINKSPPRRSLMTSEGFFNLPSSVDLKALLLRSRQSLANAGVHAVRKPEIRRLSHGLPAIDRRRLRIICRYPARTRPTLIRRKGCRSIARIRRVVDGEAVPRLPRAIC